MVCFTCFLVMFKEKVAIFGTGARSQLVRVLGVLLKDPGSFASTCADRPQSLSTPAPGESDAFLQPSWACEYMWHALT